MTIDGILARTDRLGGLLPEVREMGLALLQAALDKGIVLRVTQGFRTIEQQAAIVMTGVQAASPGWSWHEYRRAFDVCIVSYAGDSTPLNVYDGPWQMVGEIGESVGLEWGGRWKHPDRPHFEHRAGMTIAHARAQGVPELLG